MTLRAVAMRGLPPDSWHLMNHITLKTDTGTTQIDHILISDYGVFVVETKHYKGWIFGDKNSKYWTQVIFNRKFRFQNPLHQNNLHLRVVREYLDFLPQEHIQGIVVFTSTALFKSTMPENVLQIKDLLSFLEGSKKVLLSNNKRQFCIGRLESARLSLTRATDVQHRVNLNRRYR